MTAAQGTDHAGLQMLDWDGSFLRERVARHQGCQRNWAWTRRRPSTASGRHHRRQRRRGFGSGIPKISR